jgi:DNA-binding NtrC family response regulator
MDQTRRLLIVDDEETLTFSLYQSFILAKQNYEVVTASSGEEALEKIKEKPFDLVISDISMPGMSGLDLLSFIRQINPHTKVIIMTAYGSDEKREEAFDKGAVGYIEKPFEIREVKQMVLNALTQV